MTFLISLFRSPYNCTHHYTTDNLDPAFLTPRLLHILATNTDLSSLEIHDYSEPNPTDPDYLQPADRPDLSTVNPTETPTTPLVFDLIHVSDNSLARSADTPADLTLLPTDLASSLIYLLPYMTEHLNTLYLSLHSAYLAQSELISPDRLLALLTEHNFDLT